MLFDRNSLSKSRFRIIMDLKRKSFVSKEKREYFNNRIPGLITKLSEKQASISENASKIHSEWQHKRLSFLRTKTRLDTLRFVIEESQSNNKFRNSASKDQQKLVEINHMLRVVGDRKFDGLSQHITPNQTLNEKLVEVIKTEMKMKLLNTCSELSLHYSQSDEKRISIRNVAAIYQNSLDLVNMIKNDLNCLELVKEFKFSKFDDKTDLNIEKQKKQRLKDHLQVLNKIVDTHLTSSVPKLNDTNVDHLAAKVTVIHLLRGRLIFVI